MIDIEGLTDVFSLVCAGLEPIGNTAGNPARFIVETFSAGRGDLTVTVLNPRGVQEPASSNCYYCILVLH